MTGARAIALAHSVDLLTFLLVVPYGIAGESNFIARTAFEMGGLLGVMVLKAAGIAGLIYVAQGSSLRTGVAVAAGVLCALTNVAALVVLRGG